MQSALAERMLFERTPDLVVVAGRDGRVVSMNPAARAFLGGRGADGAGEG